MSAPRRLALPAERGEIHPEHQGVEVRFTNTKGETEVWMLQAGSMTFVPADAVLLAYVDTGVDLQKELQREHINRLLAHLKWHHEHLNEIQTVKVLGTDVCWYGHKEAEGQAQR